LANRTGTPALGIVTRPQNASAARVALANLNAPLTQLFSAPSAGPGVVPEESDVQVGGVNAHQLQLGPGLQLDYAVFHGLVVVATSLRGIGDVAARQQALSDDPSYQRAVGDQSSGVTSLGFADFSQLLSLAEQTSLPHSAGFLALQPDLQRIRAVGVSSKRGETDTTAEMFLQIP